MQEPREPSNEAKDERLNFRASGQLVAVLSDLKNKYGISMSESIRRGVTLFSLAKREAAKGRTMAFLDEDGKVVAEVHSI